MFEECESLKSVNIPENVTKIGDNAFTGCKTLKSITVPKSVKTIDRKGLGYTEVYYNDLSKVPGFTIYGYAGTAAEAYAKENDFIFIEIKDESAEKPTEVPSDTAITVGATGKLSPRFEMTKDGLLSAISKVLTDEQFMAIKSGKSALEIRLAVTDIDADVSDADQELIYKAVEKYADSSKLNFKVLNYLEIKLCAVIDGKELSVDETNGMITVSVAVENPANGTYKVVRLHDGKAEVIDAAFDQDAARLAFATDRFSTYAILYSDVASGDSSHGALVTILVLAGVTAVAALIRTKRNRPEGRSF